MLPSLHYREFGLGVNIFGATQTLPDTDGNVVSNLSSIQVKVNGTAAPLLYFGQSLINAGRAP
jgi:uncharacterized protein (TIGR03437 family)